MSIAAEPSATVKLDTVTAEYGAIGQEDVDRLPIAEAVQVAEEGEAANEDRVDANDPQEHSTGCGDGCVL
eukprot:CAMPEP_0117065804 /NCGR_PEP_ID=MMETSP0472-20121206/46024_1 /TAXON_ID=693140 ORGANISM="Tiarina fusus, Strain LIS" /NCGR_SAMPLE_ID=MMETSP0472 /ASSEMBLY_ACC=CAM_ASM_000603 /LENGTH=69 /DNA_ID=CAMNT_0004786619 /DNA_START=103 /DNA_END=308 /DNA_ORIENTATION=+